MHKYDVMMDWLAGLYVNILNLIQYMHDKYYYEAAEMALIDTDVRRTFATGIAGFSHVVDSLSAIKYAKVKCHPRRARASSPITRSRAISRSTATMMTAPMTSPYELLQHLPGEDQAAATPTATPSPPPRS